MNPDRIDDIYQTILEQSARESEHHAEMMREIGAILSEAKRTNGRITKLEGDVDALQSWRWGIIGGTTVVVALYEAFKEKLKF